MYNTGNTSKNVTTTSIVDGTISNADVDASAAIAQSKLATLAITDSEVANDALSGDKIDGGTISGSVTLVTPDIGTPSAGVLTSCSGTAASLTAGNVTTNANLTGVVTSTGNATAIAADAISGDKIDGGTISDFASTGIDDNATSNQVTITDTGLGVGASPDDYHSMADNLVVYSSADAGMTIASGTSSDGRIFFADGTTGSDESMGQIRYNHDDDSMHFVTADSTSAITIDSSGNAQFSYSGSETAERLKVGPGDGQQHYCILTEVTSANDRFHLRFENTNGIVGSIKTLGTATSYNTSSDYRLKENVVPMTGSIDRLKELKPSRFNFIADADTTVDGFLAHEAQEVVPEAITGTKDAMTDEVLYTEDDELPEGKSVGDVKEASVPDYQGIDQSKLVPLLVGALQEAITRIETLENT